MAEASATLVIEPPSVEELEVTAPAQVLRVEKVTAVIVSRISAAIPAIRNGKQRITPEIKREISRIRLVKSAEEADSRYLSLFISGVIRCQPVRARFFRKSARNFSQI